ncbi:MAG: translation initiation factor IF-2 [Vulcanimicrobiota bacterium]
MGKVRVYELARELGMEDSKHLMRIIRDMGIKVKTASSGLSADAVRKIREVVAPHIEQARRDAEEKQKQAEQAKAKQAAEQVKPSRVVRIVKRASDAQKEAILERHRRKMAGETPTASVQEVMQTASEPIPEPVVEEAPPVVEETVEMPALESEVPAEETAPVTVEMPAVEEQIPASVAAKATEASKAEAERARALPPDQAIAIQYREQSPRPAPPVTAPAPPPTKKSAPAAKTGERDRRTGTTAAGAPGTAKRGGGRTREITQQSRGPRRHNFRQMRGSAKKRRRHRRRNEDRIDRRKSIEIPEMISVGDLASRMEVPASDVIKYLLKQGQMVTINQGLDYDTASSIIESYGFDVAEAEDELPDLELLEEEVDENLQGRPPVITVLGHVDHGKTSLLDAIRETNVTAGEAGGITQRIGAYQVEYGDKIITFIDTPGHEAFTEMRARGAQVTDIAVLVVAADDGVMPQTIEAINHVKAAGVPIVVAMNKIDKPQTNPDRVMQQLAEHNLVVEAWGGDVPCVPVSALQKIGIDELLEILTLLADIQELTANPDRDAEGIIIEAGLSKGLGPVATVLVKNGTLCVGDTIVVGDTWGRVRGLLDENGERIEEAGPSTPAEIVGLSDVPDAGDRLVVVDDEKMARQVSEARTEKSRRTRIKGSGRTTLEDLFAGISQGEQKELRLLIKADGHGSVEALGQSLEKLTTDEVRVSIVHSAVGAISESDVMLASASDAIIIGFNVRPATAVKRLADQEQVEMRLYTVIYHALEEVKKAMAGLLAPEIQEVELGKVEIRQVFKISKTGRVAGCMVIEGKVTRDANVRLVRDGILIYDGKLDSLRRFKDDVREVTEGYECGLTIENYADIQEGDILEAYKKESIARESI